ncbi:oligosaccharide flippase family protein [soil metagenome]
MPRLLRPAEFAMLTQLFGILLVEAIGTQVIQSATAKLAAQYRARENDAALHVFVRRWLRRIAVGALVPSVLLVAASPLLAGALQLTTLSVALLGVTLFLAIVLTFALGLLQGLGRFGWLGANLITQAGTRLLLGAALVLVGTGVDGAFLGAALAYVAAVVLAGFPLSQLLRAAHGADQEPHLAPGETRFFLLAGVVILAYAGLTNVDAVLARVLLAERDAGAYAGAITMGKIVLFAPVAVGFLLLERTARAPERGEDTERPLFLALAFVLVTSGLIALLYIVAPAFVTGIVVGSQYTETPALVPLYGIAALANALLSIWNAYFIGKGQMRVGLLLAGALLAETVLLVLLAHDGASMVRIVLGVAVVTQAAAVVTFALTRRRAS